MAFVWRRNAGAQRIFGYTASEVVGKPITILIPPELWDEERKFLEKLRAGERVEHYETVRITKAGKKVYVSLSIAPIKDSSGGIVGFSKIARDITERRLARSKMVEIQEKERTRIARDLHDDINQRLALLAVEIDRLKRDPPNSAAELSCQLADVREGITEVSAEVQSISHQLHSPQLEYLGIVAAMKGFCRDFAARHAVEIDFESDDIAEAVPPHYVSFGFYRKQYTMPQNIAEQRNSR